ncbi:MAG TPA: SagB family peptide dehydrogenase [Pyrinomonadaceae bacterium]|nr:SagB family peptide dehydrogenase [Pyrinomonadaceae bacterium]
MTLFLSVRERVTLERLDDASLVLRDETRSATLKGISEATQTAFESIAGVGEQEDLLAAGIAPTDGPLALAKFRYYLRSLDQLGWLVRSLRLDDKRLASLLPISPGFYYSEPDLQPNDRFALSRFVYLHAVDGEMIVESPLAHARIVLHDARAAVLVHALSRPHTAVELIDECSYLPADSVQQLIALLAAAGMTSLCGENGTTLEDENTMLMTWEFHDLLFHSRSRQGRHDYPSGAAFKFLGTLDQPPALKPVTTGELIDLYRPELDRLKRDDVPLARVQEERRSIREYDSSPITINQLGEFLYRVGRVKEQALIRKPSPRGMIEIEVAQRPYPAAGGLYELELYVVSNACEDLDPGHYHYEPQTHQLRKISAPSAHTESLLMDASQGTTVPREKIQILIIVAARFQRISWKYSSMAYAATLKNTGVLFQTMYLVATAMGLAPCAVGSGNSDVFAHAAGVDYYEESSVGEFLLGTRA